MNPADDPLELDAETMRRLGYQVVDRLVDRITHLNEDAAWRGAPRAHLEPRLQAPPGEDGRPFDLLLDQLYDDVLAFAARVDHPRFMAFVPGSPTWPGILADFVAAGHNIFQGTWLGGSGPSMLELVVLDWFRDWVGYPPSFGGLFLSGGSAANLTALACARLNTPSPEKQVLYLGQEVHSSVWKAARVAGFDQARVRQIASDADFRLDLDALRAAIAADRAEGLRPAALVASAGTTSTGAIDPLPQLADLAAKEGLWFHIDAAYGGFVVLTRRGQALLAGLERADSITLDPHKWLYQPFETGCLLVRDAKLLERAFSLRPDYLQDTAVAGSEVNFGERGIQLTRAPRALKVWLSVQHFGLRAFRQTIDRCLDLALYAQHRIEQSGVLELLTPAQLGIVCFRRVWPGADSARTDDLNARLVHDLGQSGVGLISSTRVRGLYALRFCILNHRTTRDDVDTLIRWLERH